MNAQDLKNHQWEHRILIIKTSAKASKEYKEQLREFKDEAKELKERGFVVYTIVGEDFELTNYKNSALNNSGKLSGKLAKILNHKESFEVLLIGLDGGIKLQQTQVLKKEDLFKTVDSMPMRRSEIRNNKN